jgi:hypothetical protein
MASKSLLNISIISEALAFGMLIKKLEGLSTSKAAMNKDLRKIWISI